MTAPALGALQVAAMLVSASYGIGFLFGSGEFALRHGMAGALYGIATAAGLAALGAFAGRLWRLGVPVWDLFGQAYGERVRRVVALLSVVWMSGVLAAQILGGVAVARLLGLGEAAASVVVLLLILLAARLHLALAAALFAACLLLSGLVLVLSLLAVDGGPVYASALPAFVSALPELGSGQLVAVVLGVGLMAVAGSDYHQFVQAARDEGSARRGCLLAAILLVALALLPPAVVVASREVLEDAAPGDTAQVIPFLLARTAAIHGPGADRMLLIALSAAALGSGAAVLRAMAAALRSAWPPWAHPTMPSLALGALLAGRGEGIVETMVAVNVVYLAGVCVAATALWIGRPIAPSRAVPAMLAGLVASALVQLVAALDRDQVVALMGMPGMSVDLVSLLTGLVVSLLVARTGARQPRRAAQGPSEG